MHVDRDGGRAASLRELFLAEHVVFEVGAEPADFSGMTSALYPVSFRRVDVFERKVLLRSCSPARVAKSLASSAASGDQFFTPI